jgi:tellurite resistance protein TehA-like permease
MRMGARVAHAVTQLHAGVFAIVMATGIVAIAAGQQGFAWAARGLLAIAAAALLVSWVLLAWRVLACGRQVAADLRDFGRAPEFFAVVAGTAVVGSGAESLLDAPHVAAVLLAISACAWIVLTYAVPAALITARDKPLTESGVDGTWLLAVVDTQALAVLAASLAARAPAELRSGIAFAALCAWLLGATLYSWIATLLLHRAFFLRFEPADLTPGWWINMGAMAISTLAGAQLVLLAPGIPLLDAMQPFVRGGVVLCWTTATWWVPLLLVLNVWKYLEGRQALHYGLAQWSAVFPLGMYSVATRELADALGIEPLAHVATVVFWIAALAWLAAAWGLLRAGLESARED